MAAAVWVEVGRGKRSAAEPAPSYLSSRTKTLCTCTSNPCFRSATGPSTGSLVGRPSTRGRIYVAFGEHPAAGGWGLKFVGWVVSVLCVVCVFVCGCCLCVCSCVFVFVSLFYWVCYCLFVSSCACCWRLWVSLWHFAGPCGVSLALWPFGWPWGSILAPWVSILTHMGYSWESFEHCGETLGLQFCSCWVSFWLILVSCEHFRVWP